MPRQKNTKEKILQCAFGLYRKPRLSEISLSEIAAAAGISKTAIFRHYKNKDDLLEKMRESFFEAIDLMISRLDGANSAYSLKSVAKVVHCVFDFCSQYPNYLSYFLQESCTDELLAEGVNMALLDNGFDVIHKDIFKDKKNYLLKNMIPSFFQQTLLIFLTLAETSKNCLVEVKDIEEYKRCLSELIYSGFGKRKNPLSVERKKELDELCKVQLEGDEKSNRFFNAFVELIQNNGSSKITVEKIASALGMAKSSIYSFFANKDDYLVNMLFQETERICSALAEKASAATNFDEVIYIIMRTQANYFALRPRLIALHGYFIFREGAMSPENLARIESRSLEFSNAIPFKEFIPKAFDFPVTKNWFLLVRWISGLTVVFMLMGTKYNFPPDWLDFYVSSVYEMIECGIKHLR